MRGAREGEALFWAALAQWGLRLSRKQLRTSDGLTLLERRRVPEVWRRSIESAYTTMFGRADGPATLRGRGYVWPLLDALFIPTA